MINQTDISGFTAHRIREAAALGGGYVLDRPEALGLDIRLLQDFPWKPSPVLLVFDQADDDVTDLVKALCKPRFTACHDSWLCIARADRQRRIALRVNQ